MNLSTHAWSFQIIHIFLCTIYFMVLMKCVYFHFTFLLLKTFITETCFYMCELHYVMWCVLPQQWMKDMVHIERGKPTQPVGLQVLHYRLFLELIKAGVQKIPNIWMPPQNSGHQKDDMKQVPYWGPTNIMPHRTKFSRHGDLAPGIFALLT